MSGAGKKIADAAFKTSKSIIGGIERDKKKIGGKIASKSTSGKQKKQQTFNRNWTCVFDPSTGRPASPVYQKWASQNIWSPPICDLDKEPALIERLYGIKRNALYRKTTGFTESDVKMLTDWENRCKQEPPRLGSFIIEDKPKFDSQLVELKEGEEKSLKEPEILEKESADV